MDMISYILGADSEKGKATVEVIGNCEFTDPEDDGNIVITEEDE